MKVDGDFHHKLTATVMWPSGMNEDFAAGRPHACEEVESREPCTHSPHVGEEDLLVAGADVMVIKKEGGPH